MDLRHKPVQVFIRTPGWSFPIGIDQPSDQESIPLTMQAYGLRGTPSLVILDRQGRIRLNHFGQVDDLAIGALLGQLVSETSAPVPDKGHHDPGAAKQTGSGCDGGICTVRTSFKA